MLQEAACRIEVSYDLQPVRDMHAPGSSRGRGMPYRNARYFMFVVIAVILGGFWPSYFAVWTNVPWQFHAHGVAASIWVTMVTAQTWTAHNKSQLALHRTVGRTSLFLFPFLIAGLAAILDRSAKGFVSGDGPVRIMFGPTFMIGIAVTIAAYVTLYYRALKYRRKVWVHAGYMLSTPLILFESPFSRLLAMFMPGLTVRGPADFGRIIPGILWSMALELVVVAVIWLRFRDKAKPFLVAGAFIVAQMIAMGLLGKLAVLRPLEYFVGNLPDAVIVATGFAIGALTSWAGWQAGKQPTVPVGAVAQPA
jgi:hypothetical protein